MVSGSLATGCAYISLNHLFSTSLLNLDLMFCFPQSRLQIEIVEEINEFQLEMMVNSRGHFPPCGSFPGASPICSLIIGADEYLETDT